MNVYEQVINIISDELGIDEDKINGDSTLDELGIDEAKLFLIILDCEDKWNIPIPDDLILNQVSDLVQYI